MGDRGFRSSRMRTVMSEERANLSTGGSMRGCKRGGKWCLFSKWEQITVPDEEYHPMVKNVMECRICMNHIPTSRNSGESVFSSDGSGPWMTAIESYGSTLDSLIEGAAHQAGEDVEGRFYTGNEEFIPGDDEAYEEIEVQFEEVTRGMHPAVTALLSDLVFHHGCRIIAIHPDRIECEDDPIARDVIRRERTMGEPTSRDPICPCFLHPALVFIPSFSLVRSLIKLMISDGLIIDAMDVIRRINSNLDRNMGNLKTLLEEESEKKAWLESKKLALRAMMAHL